MYTLTDASDSTNQITSADNFTNLFSDEKFRSDDEIILQNDISFSQQWIVAKNCTLNLNGHDFTSNFKQDNQANIIINDSINFSIEDAEEKSGNVLLGSDIVEYSIKAN